MVRTDRVAMAVLAYELMVVRSSDLEELKQPTLFEQMHLDEGSVEIPARLESRWPEGAALVRRALGATDPEVAADKGGPPSPDEWLAALRVAHASSSLPGIPAPRRAPEPPPQPRLSYTVVCHITHTDTDESWEFEMADEGTFKGVHVWLSWLGYERVSESTVRLRGQLPQEYWNEDRVEYFISVGRDYHRRQRLDEQYDDACDIIVTDGDHLEVGAFNLDFVMEATND